MTPCPRPAQLCAFILLSLFVTTAHAQTPSLVYATSFGSVGTDHAHAAATDASDNVIIVGNVGGPIDMGGGPLVSTNSTNLVLAKYDSGGAHLWSILLGDPNGWLLAWDLATDAAGNIYVAGRVYGTVDLGGGPLGNGGSGDAFVAKYSSAGVHQWSQSFGEAGTFDTANALAVDPAGNVVIAGRFQGTLDFGGGPLTPTVGSALFLVKFDTNGVHQWSQKSGGAGGGPTTQSVTIDNSGNIILGGRFTDIDFGGGVMTAIGPIDSFLAKFDSNGNYIWSTQFGGTSSTDLLAVAVDTNGNIAFGGQFRETTTVGAFSMTSLGSWDGFVGQCDPSGVVQWAYTIGGAGGDRVTEVRIGPSDGVHVAGYIFETAQVGGAPPLVGSSTSLTLYTVKYGPSGAHEWSKIIGDGNIEHLVIDSTGSFYVFSEFTTSIVLDTVTLNSLGTFDYFLTKYFPSQPVPVVFQSFTARPSASGVEVAWSFGDVAGLQSYALHRSTGVSAPIVVASGPIRGEGLHRDSSVEAGRDYDYELSITTVDGFELRSQVSHVTAPRFAASLAQNSPNPFNPRTTIRYSVGQRARVVIEIFDVSGSLVRRLDAGDMEPGAHQIEWDGRDASGKSVASGNYYYRIAGSQDLRGRKMTLIK